MTRIALIAAALAFATAQLVSVSAPRAKETAPASADELFDALAALPGLRADYTEEKFLSVLVDPVVSEGQILFAPPSKLVRVTTKPIWSSLVVEENALRYRDATGPQKIPASKGDPARAFVEVFLDVARGNRKALARTFTVKFASEKGAGWRLTLTPKKKGLGLVRIELAGTTTTIGTMTIEDTNGDRTVMTFKNIVTKRPSKKQLTRALRQP